MGSAMKFIIVFSFVAISAFVMADDAEDKQQLEEFAKVFKDQSLSPEDKKAKFAALTSNLKGDIKAKFEQFAAEAKTAVESLKSPGAQAAAQKLSAMWQDGTMFQPKEKVQAAVEEALKDVSPEDKEALQNLGKSIGEKFKAAFKDALPTDQQ